MENLKEQQVEALEAMIEYNKKLIPALQEVVIELNDAQQEDTKQYLDYILKGVNWVIQIVNGTKDLLNTKSEIVVKEEVNQIIDDLNKAVKEGDNSKTATIIEDGIMPFILKISEAAKDAVAIEK